MKQYLIALVSGLIFGFGLGLSQMIDQSRVLGFMDIAGVWDPTLLFVLGGAVGDEVDRHDVSLGSPAHAHVLASSTPLGNEYQLVIEEQTLALPDQGGQHKPSQVRSDMIYFTTDNGGAIFSIGSMTFAGALAWNDFNNSIARITTNVLEAFTSELPAE